MRACHSGGFAPLRCRCIFSDGVQHDIFDQRAFHDSVRHERAYLIRLSGETGKTKICLCDAGKKRPGFFGEPPGAAFHHSVRIQQNVLLFFKENGTVVNEHKNIGDLVQIRSDVRGKENAFSAAVHIVGQCIQHLTADQGVQSTGGFIHDEEFRLVGERQRQSIFRTHSFRQRMPARR